MGSEHCRFPTPPLQSDTSKHDRGNTSNRRPTHQCFSSDDLRKLIMLVVMLDKSEENKITATIKTPTVNARSAELAGTTSIDAGVNCVKLQCKAVV